MKLPTVQLSLRVASHSKKSKRFDMKETEKEMQHERRNVSP